MQTTQVLLIGGTVRPDTVAGIASEWAAMLRRMQDSPTAAAIARSAPLYPRLTRICIRPEWVGLLDFATGEHLPSAVERAIARQQTPSA